jgi:hypothetical protein
MRLADAVLHAEMQINWGRLDGPSHAAFGATYQLHQVVVDLAGTALHDEDVLSADRLANLDAGLTDGELGEQPLRGRYAEVVAYLLYGTLDGAESVDRETCG